MKKTKPILALLAALALLFAAACEQGLSPSSPDLGNYNDARTNQKYTSNKIQGTSYFPTIAATNANLNGGAGTPANKDSAVTIDFDDVVSVGAANTAIAKAKAAKLTLDILQGDVEANIKAAIFFAGVKYPTTAGVGVYNAYTVLSYEITAIDRTTVYVKLGDLAAYDAVQPYIKASEYKLSGKPIDTDGNLIGGESPYDDHDLTALAVTDGAASGGGDTPRQNVPIAFDDFSNHGSSTSANIYWASEFLQFSQLPNESFAGLSGYIKLEKWNAASKTWADSSIAGAYATTGDFAGYYYFNIPVSPTGYDKYRIVAKDLYKFETGESYGFKHRFAYYPGHDSGDADAADWKVTVKDGTKVLDTKSVIGADYEKKHRTGNIISGAVATETDENNKNTKLIITVNTALTGNLGLATLPALADFNKNFKLVYQDQSGVWEYVGITDAKIRIKPGTVKSTTTGAITQQLVLTLDPNFTWVNGRTISIYAREGITYAGDDPLVTTGRIESGSLGDANGTTNIDGYWDWRSYGNFVSSGGANAVPASGASYVGVYTGSIAVSGSLPINSPTVTATAIGSLSIKFRSDVTLIDRNDYSPGGSWTYIIADLNGDGTIASGEIIGVAYKLGTQKAKILLGENAVDSDITAELRETYLGFETLDPEDIASKYAGTITQN
jgi:hypothetical protein